MIPENKVTEIFVMADDFWMPAFMSVGKSRKSSDKSSK